MGRCKYLLIAFAALLEGTLLIACVPAVDNSQEIWPMAFPAESLDSLAIREPELAGSLVRDGLGIAPRFVIRRIDKFLDGGSIGGVLEGADGGSVEFFWNRNLPDWRPETSLQLAYLADESGVRRLLQAGSPRERALILALHVCSHDLSAYPDSGWMAGPRVASLASSVAGGLQRQRNLLAAELYGGGR